MDFYPELAPVIPAYPQLGGDLGAGTDHMATRANREGAEVDDTH